MKIKKAKPRLAAAPKRPAALLAIGFDISPSSIAGCAKTYDPVLKKMLGPVWYIKRWTKDVPLFERMGEVARGERIIEELLKDLKVFIRDLDDVYIGVEEPPARILNARNYREQCEIEGAFVGGLKRWGYQHVFSANVKSWHKVVADDLGVKVNSELTKWVIKDWAQEVHDAPDWPDLIRHGALGLIPKPESSNANPAQPDDRYDSCGIMEWVYSEKMPKRTNRKG